MERDPDVRTGMVGHDMSYRQSEPDPLSDGSTGSYVARFFICFILGIFADLLILAGMALFTPRLALYLWPLWLLLPVLFGVAGVFAFDTVVELYDRLHDDDTND